MGRIVFQSFALCIQNTADLFSFLDGHSFCLRGCIINGFNHMFYTPLVLHVVLPMLYIQNAYFSRKKNPNSYMRVKNIVVVTEVLGL